MKKIKKILHHLFVPKRENNFRSKALHHDFLTIYLLLAISVTVGIQYLQNKGGSVLGYATDITVQKLLDLTNQERERNNLPILTYNEQLAQAAQRKADDMFAKNYWAHYAPDGTTPWSFILASGYSYEYAGENLAKNFLFSNGVVEAWMNSPTHRENMLRKDYTDIGFAVVNGMINGEETTLVVQMFGKPLYAAAKQPQAVAQEPAVQQQQVPAVEIDPGTAVKPVVLAKEDSQPSINLLPMYIRANILFFVFLISALVIDFYIATKYNLLHLRGKNVIHIMFLVFITLGILTLIKGSIT